jgi:hypothetical protein
MRDPQARLVYRWEGKWKDWNRTTMTLQECRDLIKWACRHFKLKISPRVKQNKNRNMSYSRSDVPKPFISLRAADHKNRCVALHEAAHFIADEIFGNKVQWHGKEFMGVYIRLLIKSRIAPAVALITSAKAEGLEWLEVRPGQARAD